MRRKRKNTEGEKSTRKEGRKEGRERKKKRTRKQQCDRSIFQEDIRFPNVYKPTIINIKIIKK